MNKVRIPQIIDIKTAIQMYYERIELSSSDIAKLFGKRSSSTVTALKSLARQKMIEQDTPCWNAVNVNTAAAFEAWGLSIDDLEERYKKLKEYE